MLRKFTIYLRNNGTDLLTHLFEKDQYSFEEFYKWFRVSKASKEHKIENVKRIVQRLIDTGLVKLDNEKKSYYLTQDAEIRATGLVNSGKIRYELIHHFENELLSPKDLYYFTSPFSQLNFYSDLQELVVQNLHQVNFWKDIGNLTGQILSYVRAEEYYKKIVQSKIEIKPHYSIENIQSELNDKAYLTTTDDYFFYKNHFKKCFNRRCNVCGKNIINLISIYLEKIKAEIRSLNEYPILRNYIKKLPYKKEIDEGESKKIYTMIDSLIQYDDEQFGKTRSETIKYNLNQELKMCVVEIVHSNRVRIRDRSDFAKVENCVTIYRESTREFYRILEPNPILSGIDTKIGEKFPLDQKTFREYNKSIRALGREGEKRIYEGLLEDYRDHPAIRPIWMNDEKELGEHYDILLSNTSGKDVYVEVKTTHTDQRSFIMSEEEFKFAMDNSKHYRLYFIVNFGLGADSYVEIIDNFKEEYGKRLRLISKRFKYD